MIQTSLKRLIDYIEARLSGRRLPIKLDVRPSGEQLCVIRSAGLAQRGMPELEINSCPVHLVRYGSEVILQIAANGLQIAGSLADGKIVGGHLVHPQQDFLERCRLVQRTGPAEVVLRVCDVESSDVDECPRRLLAAHLCALGSLGGAESALHFRLATEEYPIVRAASNAPLSESELNPNNFWAWEGLGSWRAEILRLEDAVSAWKAAVCRWPRGGKFIAGRMAHELETLADTPSRAALMNFWNSLSDDSIRAWGLELGIEIEDVTLLP